MDFDLAGILGASVADKIDDPHSRNDNVEEKITIFSMNHEFKAFVSEAFKFEGLNAPFFLNLDEIKSAENLNAKIFIIDLTLCDENTLLIELDNLRHHLPMKNNVLVATKSDSVKMLTKVEHRGFVFLKWPINKIDFINFINHVSSTNNKENESHRVSLRLARKIGVISTKGGCGVTFFATQISKILSEERKINSLIVDNSYLPISNMDLLLGIERWEKQIINESDVSAIFDKTIGMSMTRKIGSNLSSLALTSSDISAENISFFNNEIVESLLLNFNFIINDFSSVSMASLTNEWLLEHLDILIVVIDNDIASLKESSRRLKAFEAHNASVNGKSKRIITIFNESRINNSINLQEIEKYLGYKVNFTFEFDKNFGNTILTKKKLYTLSTKFQVTFNSIISEILGEQFIESKKSWLGKIVGGNWRGN
jgi:pilus assembly protein CpaE